MGFRISGLASRQFAHLFGRPDDVLAANGAVRRIVDEHPGYPCRIALVDAPLGRPVLLVNYEHLPVATPFRSRHAVYVQEDAEAAALAVGEVPAVLRRRVLSVRAFDRAGMMVDADIVDGVSLEPVVERLLGIAETEFLHVHFAKPGCFAARVDRA